MRSTTRRIRPTIRLRTLFFGVALLGAVVAPFACKLRNAREQKLAVQWVLRNGGAVTYDWEVRGDSKPPASSWRRWLGDDFIQVVLEAEFPAGLSDEPDNRTSKSPTQIRDLSNISTLSRLRRLHLWDTEVTDLEPLRKLHNLREVVLAAECVTELGSLSHLTGLRKLHITAMNRIDIAPLAELSELRDLTLFGRIDSFAPISSLKKLRTLRLDETDIQSLRPMAHLKNLRELYLVATPISDLSPLYGLAKLEVLFIPSTPNIDDDDVNQLAKKLPACKIVR